jgi:hypothetical protein
MDDIETLAMELGGKLGLPDLLLLVKYLTFISFGMAQLRGQEDHNQPTVAAAPKPKGGKAAAPVVEDETPF